MSSHARDLGLREIFIFFFVSGGRPVLSLHLFLILHDRFFQFFLFPSSILYFYQSFRSSCLHQTWSTYTPMKPCLSLGSVQLQSSTLEELVFSPFQPKVAEVRGPISQVQLVMALSSSEDRMIVAWVDTITGGNRQADCQSLKGSSPSGWGSSGTWPGLIPRKTCLLYTSPSPRD